MAKDLKYFFQNKFQMLEPELVENIKEPTLHSDFRKMQDIIKKLNGKYMILIYIINFMKTYKNVNEYINKSLKNTRLSY